MKTLWWLSFSAPLADHQKRHIDLETPIQWYQDWLEVVESQEEEDSERLVKGLAEQLFLDASTLYMYQMAIRDVVLEDILS